jgi:hypothetical protein
MVRRVKRPPDVPKPKNLEDAASGVPGLNAIDEERAASMADEGGVSGPAVEDRPKKPKEDFPKRPMRRRGR